MFVRLVLNMSDESVMGWTLYLSKVQTPLVAAYYTMFDVGELQGLLFSGFISHTLVY